MDVIFGLLLGAAVVYIVWYNVCKERVAKVEDEKRVLKRSRSALIRAAREWRDVAHLQEQELKKKDTKVSKEQEKYNVDNDFFRR